LEDDASPEKERVIDLRPPDESDAEVLFPLIHGTSVPDTLAWDGPQSLAEYRHALRVRGGQVAAGRLHFFTILERASGKPIGSCDVRPDEDGSRAMVGLWIGEPYQGKGLGSVVIGELARYAFEVLDMVRVEADVFVGNTRSRRAFERNGFKLLRTIPKAVMKGGKPVDEWRIGLERDEWKEQENRRSS
jgi:RimJ/RimL family protein N-acetyltransferase